MLHKIAQIKPQLHKTLDQVQQVYQAFRLYDVASFALNRLTLRRGYELKSHLAYGVKDRQYLDLYLSHQPHAKKPLIVFVHGGAWTTGDKKSYRFLGQTFATQGFNVAIINYQLAPTHIFPSSVHDLALALEFLTEQQHELGIATEHIVLMGHSAGAFNVMSLLYHPQSLALSCFDCIRAVIGLAGPYHFDYKGDVLCEHAFDVNVPYTDVMPFYFVRNNHIQHYLFRAQNDTVVGANNATDLQQALNAVGNHHEVIDIEKTGHVTIIGSLAHWFSPYFATKSQVLAVLERSLAD